MPTQYFRTTNARQTMRLGAIVAKELLHTDPGGRAIIVALIGDLGSGKTTFTQGFARALGVRRRTASPTFLFCRTYPIERNRTLYHIDCYRIRSPRDLAALGFRDWISHPDHIVVIEWAEKLKQILPRHAIRIRFSHGKTPHERIIAITTPR